MVKGASDQRPEVGIYERNILRKIERKHVFDHDERKKTRSRQRKQDLDQEKKKILRSYFFLL